MEAGTRVSFPPTTVTTRWRAICAGSSIRPSAWKARVAATSSGTAALASATLHDSVGSPVQEHSVVAFITLSCAQ